MFAKFTMVKTMNDRFLEELPDSDVSNLIRQDDILVYFPLSIFYNYHAKVLYKYISVGSRLI